MLSVHTTAAVHECNVHVACLGIEAGTINATDSDSLLFRRARNIPNESHYVCDKQVIFTAI